MISNNTEKLLRKLKAKKYRWTMELFVAEGPKVVSELLDLKMKPQHLFSDKQEWESKGATLISSSELKSASQLETSNEVIAVFPFPKFDKSSKSNVTLVLDSINDPGNLGTIIRLCDWFGVTELICSLKTVDCYNAKVVQASMGSLTRISIHYIDLKTYLTATKTPTFIADMNGENVYKTSLPKEGVLIMGNEANGVSEEIKKLIVNKISIPRFGEIQETESLNVATATAILLSEFKRGCV